MGHYTLAIIWSMVPNCIVTETFGWMGGQVWSNKQPGRLINRIAAASSFNSISISNLTWILPTVSTYSWTYTTSVNYLTIMSGLVYFSGYNYELNCFVGPSGCNVEDSQGSRGLTEPAESLTLWFRDDLIWLDLIFMARSVTMTM